MRKIQIKFRFMYRKKNKRHKSIWNFYKSRSQ